MRTSAVTLVALSLMCPPIVSTESPEWDAALDQAVGYLRQYLRLDTSNPPGDVRAAVAFLTGILSREGIEHQAFVADESMGKLNLLARLPATTKGSVQAKPLLLLNHMDVVPVERDKWDAEPFGGIIKDGSIWGRGALDMKAMGIAELMALIRLKRERVPLERDVLWLAVCDEEIGGLLGARWMVERHYDLMDPEFVVDEGGGGSRGLLTSPERIVFSPSVDEKQPLWLRLSVKGEGGHGSMPHAGNAAEILQQALARLLAAQASLEAASDHPLVSLMRQRLGTLAENRYTSAITKNTITLTSFQAGVGDPPKVNVIPSEASATLDCRLLPGVPVPEFLTRLTQLLGDPRVTVEILYQPRESAVSSPHATRLFQAIEQTVKAFFPDALVTPQLLPGGTDSRFFRAKGAIAYGFEPLILTPDDLDQIHGHNERLSVEQFRLMIQMLYEVVKRVTQSP